MEESGKNEEMSISKNKRFAEGGRHSKSQLTDNLKIDRSN